MPSAVSGENIKFTHPLCHELWKIWCLAFYSTILSHVKLLLYTVYYVSIIILQYIILLSYNVLFYINLVHYMKVLGE